jgi:hypothetical protein
MDTAAADGAREWKGTRRTARLGARMRRCLILRQGASPLRPPAPFPSFWIVRSEEDLSRVRFAGAKAAPPLTDLPRSEDRPYQEGKGASTKVASPCLPLVGPENYLTLPDDGAPGGAHEALPHTPPGGQAPLRPPHGGLDRDRPSHGSRNRQEAAAGGQPTD